MGLDITAYKDLKAVRKLEKGDELDYEENLTRFYVNPHFRPQFEGLEENTAYEYDDDYEFRAGSYGGYNAWRNELAVLAGYANDDAASAAPSGPFRELIHFSDCEGTIGPVASAKLAKDFADFEKKAEAHGGEYFLDRYRCWKKAFEMAANNGAVDFH